MTIESTSYAIEETLDKDMEDLVSYQSTIETLINKMRSIILDSRFDLSEQIRRQALDCTYIFTLLCMKLPKLILQKKPLKTIVREAKTTMKSYAKQNHDLLNTLLHNDWLRMGRSFDIDYEETQTFLHFYNFKIIFVHNYLKIHVYGTTTDILGFRRNICHYSLDENGNDVFH